MFGGKHVRFNYIITQPLNFGDEIYMLNDLHVLLLHSKLIVHSVLSEVTYNKTDKTCNCIFV